MNYRKFLDRKKIRQQVKGFSPVFLPDFLKPFQRHLVDWSVRLGRAALLEDCGLGKSIQAIVWAENVLRTQKSARVLIVTPLAVSQQFVREAEKFGLSAKSSRDGKLTKGINVTNYERLSKFNPSQVTAVIYDESGRVKNFDSRTRRDVTKFSENIHYRLLCTATPAPNDFMELGTSSEVLGCMGRNQMLAMFFTNDGESTQQWRLKGHAKHRFWQWMASWARAVRKPSDLGFDDDGYILPKLEVHRHILPSNKQAKGFFPDIARTLNAQREERLSTIKERCEKVAELLDRKRPAIIWCHLNKESELLGKLISGSVEVAGSDRDDVKEERLNAFTKGEIKYLITKPKIAGFGLNWQHCNQVFYFPSHCYDETTELLTKRGWLTFDQVNKSDDVATVNPKSLAFEWQNPISTVWSPYSGNMLQFGGGRHARSFDLLVTPNHRMFVKREPWYVKDGKWEFKLAAEIAEGYKKQEYRMLSVPVSFAGNDTNVITIPPYEKMPTTKGRFNRSGDRRGMNPLSWAGLDHGRSPITVTSIPTAKLMSLAGWYLSEGHCTTYQGRQDGQIVITQSDKNPGYRAEIIDLLNSIGGLNVYSKTHNIRCCSIQLATFLVDQFGAGSHHKRIPLWVKELSPKYLVVLRDTMLKGDGCGPRGGSKLFYRTASKRLADDFSEVCLKTGIRASVRYRQYRSEMTEKKIALGFVTPGGPFYDVSLARQNTEPSIHTKPVIVKYQGMIGCVTVPNGTLIVRRNGIPIISGNSHEQYYQAIRRCWRFGQDKQVDCHIVTTEGERLVLQNMIRKERQSQEMYAGITRSMRMAQSESFHTVGEYMKVPSWLY